MQDLRRSRGRPKGAKGKPKEIKETSDNIKRIKKEIKEEVYIVTKKHKVFVEKEE